MPVNKLRPQLFTFLVNKRMEKILPFYSVSKSLFQRDMHWWKKGNFFFSIRQSKDKCALAFFDYIKVIFSHFSCVYAVHMYICISGMCMGTCLSVCMHVCGREARGWCYRSFMHSDPSSQSNPELINLACLPSQLTVGIPCVQDRNARQPLTYIHVHVFTHVSWHMRRGKRTTSWRQKFLLTPFCGFWGLKVGQWQVPFLAELSHLSSIFLLLKEQLHSRASGGK